MSYTSVEIEIPDICKEFEIYSWCFDNIKGDFKGKYCKEELFDFVQTLTIYNNRILINDCYHKIEFEDQSDAVLFKLTWGAKRKNA